MTWAGCSYPDRHLPPFIHSTHRLYGVDTLPEHQSSVCSSPQLSPWEVWLQRRRALQKARCQKTHCMSHLQCLSTGFKMCAIQSCEGDSTMKTTHTSDRCNFWTSRFLIPFFFLIIWLDFILILWLCVSTRYFSHSPETSPSRCLSVFPAGKTQVTLMATVVRSVRRRGD